MSSSINEDIAGRLDEVAQIFAEQGANRFRVQAYQRAAAVLRELPRPVSEIYAAQGLAGLEQLPGIGESIAHSIRDLLSHGRLAMLERLRGESDPIAVLRTVPGIGKSLAWRLYEDLEIETLPELELAAHDGRLETLLGLGAKRLAGIRDTLAHRLGRIRTTPAPVTLEEEPSIAELLEVDQEYREKAAADTLKKIAPRRFNPAREAWLPVLHTHRGLRHYTVLFSNTARAHELRKTRDWVILFYDHGRGERQCTVITSEFGPLRGLRIVRGREAECEEQYREQRQRASRKLQSIPA